MTMKSAFRFILTAALLFVLPNSSHAQFSQIGHIGPSGAEVAGAMAGVVGTTGLIVYLTLHKPTIIGCVQSIGGKSSLVDEKDKRTYALTGDHLDLKAGQRMKLKGKKIKTRDSDSTFLVKRVDHDYGVCNQ
jgi:hypothetical protein